MLAPSNRGSAAMAEPEFLIVECIYSGMTQLDFTGPHTVFSRIPGARTIVASEPGGPIESDGGLVFAGTRRMAEIARCDLLFVPGGYAATETANDEVFLREFRRLAASARYLTSVCSGSLVLGAAGLLKGKRAAAMKLSMAAASPRGSTSPWSSRRRSAATRWRSRFSWRSNTRPRRRSTQAGRKPRPPACSPPCRREWRPSSPNAQRRPSGPRRVSNGHDFA